MDIEQLRKDRAALVEAARAYMDGREDKSWTAEDSKKFDAITAQIDAKDAEIDRYKAMAAFEAERLGRNGFGPGIHDDFAAMLRHGPQAATQLTESATPADGGGHFVPQETDQRILETMKNQHPWRDLMDLADIRTSHSDYKRIIMAGDAGSAWTGENDTRTNSGAPDFREATFPRGEIYARVPISNDLLADSQFDVGGLVIDSVGRTFGAAEAVAFVTGNGTNKPQGFLTGTISEEADGVRDFGTIQKIVATSIDADKLMDLYYSMAAGYRSGAAWVLSPSAMMAVRKLTDSENRHIWTDSLADGQPPRLLGLPAYESTAMGAVASGGFPVAVADWKRAYSIVDRASTFQRDPYSESDENLTVFRVRRRVSGGLLDSNAIKLLEIGS